MIAPIGPVGPVGSAHRDIHALAHEDGRIPAGSFRPMGHDPLGRSALRTASQNCIFS
ncbi:MAG: hypothetical protein IPN55_13630 [Saprospiraceae bacterium]|nr:hypothetical protein [Candidatus Brachybacter algidus]